MSWAHDIAGKATVLVYVKPQDTRLVVLVRVPMDALSEVQFPVRGPGYLDLSRADSAIKDAAQMYLTQSLHFFADGVPLPEGQLLKTRVALPDKSFVAFDSALALVNSPPLANDVDLYWKQASLDVLFEFPIPNAKAKFALEPDLNRIAMETHTVLHFLPPGGTERLFSYSGNPGRIELEPSWWYATYRFIELGFFHILDGIDHVLFLLCLVIPARSVRALIPAITAFTVAHSITLISSAFGVVPTALWFAPLIETLIALSVFYMACENVLGIQVQKRWLIVFALGLIHGFGFSFILADRMQFAGEHLVSALLAFNVGVELGQLLVLIVAAPILIWFFNRLKRVATGTLTGERIGIILLSTLVAHTAWHWCTERGEQLLKFSWATPTLDAVFFAAAMRWSMLLLGSVGAMWMLNEVFVRLAKRKAQ
ncbi:MAG: HupE/UreJ family protein [Candidatus Obscuribacterales bacterium]|nr:HupE/UreJ family protein [Steroidobacteraceae bacterium]